ncbi:MAG: hypothetical protein JWM74_236 [Myxococcaceae bacterium]|nr:hypothetical protein [Myxococcaceae bacterium]
MTRCRRGVVFFSTASALALAVAACSYDFNVFNPTGVDAAASDASDAGFDAPPPDGEADTFVPGDGGADTGDGAPACTPRVSCLTDTASCATKCGLDEQDCEAKVGCGLDPQCVPTCKTAETNCKKACVAVCTACTSDGGCTDVPACTTAAK